MYRDIIYKYTLSNVNLREEKSTKSKVITIIPKGAQIELLDAEEDWLKVRYENYEGYVYNENISQSLHPWANINLRKGPSVTSKPIIMIPRKGRVEVIENIGAWSKVIYDGKTGYINSYYLSNDGNNKNSINYKNFHSNMTKFVNENNFESSSKYLLVTDIESRYTYVFIKRENKWVELYKWQCTVGKPSTPTIIGTFYISGRKPYFGTDKYRVKYATRIKGPYYYHSILYNSEGTNIIDGRLGQALSHGCIRLATKNALWIYNTIPDGTTVFIQ